MAFTQKWRGTDFGILGDIAMLVALGVGGYWFLNNYKTLGIGGSGGGNGNVPPLEGGEVTAPPGGSVNSGTSCGPVALPANHSLDPVSCQPVAIDMAVYKQFQDKFGVSDKPTCSASTFSASTASKCQCASAGGKDVIICENAGGPKCVMTSCLAKWTAESKKKFKVDKCKCNWPTQSVVLLAYTQMYTAHFTARVKTPRILNNVAVEVG